MLLPHDRAGHVRTVDSGVFNRADRGNAVICADRLSAKQVVNLHRGQRRSKRTQAWSGGATVPPVFNQCTKGRRFVDDGKSDAEALGEDNGSCISSCCKHRRDSVRVDSYRRRPAWEARLP